MQLFKQLLVGSGALDLFSPLAALATEVNVAGASDPKSAGLYSLSDHFKLPQGGSFFVAGANGSLLLKTTTLSP